MEKFIRTEFTKYGKRENNEDSIYPNPEEEYPQGIVENLFLVCDGMGGHQKGEIASDMICSQMSKYFLDNKIETSDAEIVKNAVTFVESKFDSYITDFEESAGMGSTMTMVHFHEKGATVAHVGDSRIYIFRNGKIVYKSKDHSLVQQLLDNGVLKNEEDARNHSEKNVILQAIRGASMKATKPDAKVITDLQENDIFLLCTDGVIESLTDADIVEIFTSMPNIEAITAKIVRVCNENSSDNFSGILVQLLPEYINSLKIEEAEKLAPVTIEKEPLDKPKTMTQIVASTTEEVNKTKEDIPDTKTQITETEKPVAENNPIIEETQQEITQNFAVDEPSAVPLESTTIEETEKPIIQASPASDYPETKTSSTVGDSPKSQIINKREVANPIYESSEEEQKPKFVKFLLFGLVGVVLAVLAYFIIHKKEETNVANIENISDAVSKKIKEEDNNQHQPKVQSENLISNDYDAQPKDRDNNSADITPVTSTPYATSISSQNEITNAITTLNNYFNKKDKTNSKKLLNELKDKISRDKYNSLLIEYKQKFETTTTQDSNSSQNPKHENTDLKKEFLIISNDIEAKMKEAPKKAKDLFDKIDGKYKNLPEYNDLKNKIKNNN